MNIRKLITVGAIGCFLASGCVSSTTTGSIEREGNDGDAAQLNYTLGVKYLQAGSFELARDRLMLATELNPRMGAAYSALGRAYQELGNTRLASEAYSQSVRVAPRDFSVQNAYAVFLCGQENYKDAERAFDRAIEHPENDGAYVTMTNAGMCMAQKPDPAKAEEYFRAAIDRKPGHGEALLQLCLMKYGQKDFMSARAFLQRYMSTNVTTAGVLYLASRIENELGNDRGRMDYENQLLREYPSSPEAKRVLGTG